MNTNATKLFAAVIVVLGCAIAYDAGARRAPAAPDRPAIVATVDLERVFEALSMRQDLDTQREILAKSLQGSIEDRRQSIEESKEQLDALAPDSKLYDRTLNELRDLVFEFDAYVEFTRQKIERAKSEDLRLIYEDVKKSSQELADLNDYDLVLLNDSLSDLAAGGTQLQTLQQISARRILFARDELDISDQLIQYMNNK